MRALAQGGRMGRYKGNWQLDTKSVRLTGVLVRFKLPPTLYIGQDELLGINLFFLFYSSFS